MVNFFHCLYNPTPKTKIWFNLHKLKIITNVTFSESLSFIPFVISPKYIFFYVCRNSKWASLAQYWVNALFYMHNSMEVWFWVILKKFLGIKGSNLQQMFSSWLSLVMIILNYIFVLGVGLYGRWKKFTMHPPNYVQNCHFQRRENMNFILNSQSAIIYHYSNWYHRAFRDPKRLFKVIKMSKNRFYPRPPYTPTAAVIFWPALSHFSTD